MSCALVRRYIGAYTDLELDPATLIEFDKHLSACAGCQEHAAFERSVCDQLPHALKVAAPMLLAAKIQSSLEREANSQGRSPSSGALVQFHPWNWKQGWPVAAAAVALLVVASVVRLQGDEQVQTAGMLEDMVTLHSGRLPSDVAARPNDDDDDAETTQQVADYFRGKVRFPVRPAVFDRQDTRLVGARLSNLRDRRVAALYYEFGGRRVTVVVFEGQEDLHARARRTRVGDQEMMYYLVGGHTVPVRQQAGLHYAFVGDFDRETLIRIAASARVPF